MRGLWRTPIAGRLVFQAWCADARRKYRWVAPWLPPGGTLLEVGSGPGSVLKEFRSAGHLITGLDITDSSYTLSLAPMLYNGGVFPFDRNQFDAALLLTMLHHTPAPDDILREAMRVARRLIIVEDVYESQWQERATKATDSLLNLEFLSHPHTNRTDKGWQQAFKALGLTLRHRAVYPVAGIFRQAVYVVEQAGETEDMVGS
ncbi:MAG: class I SAM-dependent methyltransferase [Pseudomonadota bacterium]